MPLTWEDGGPLVKVGLELDLVTLIVHAIESLLLDGLWQLRKLKGVNKRVDDNLACTSGHMVEFW